LKVTFSGIAITEGQGKLGGTVFQRGRYGPIARQQFRPSTQNLAFELSGEQKSFYRIIAPQWKLNVLVDPATWNAAAPSPLSGYAYFMQVNLAYFRLHNTYLTDPPIPKPLGSIAPSTLTYNSGTNIYDFKYAGTAGDNANVINFYAYYNTSPGVIAPVRSRFRWFFVDDLAVGSITETLDIDWRSIPMRTDLKVFLGWRIMDSITGLQTPFAFMSAIQT